jgi:hypothetical protein
MARGNRLCLLVAPESELDIFIQSPPRPGQATPRHVNAERLRGLEVDNQLGLRIEIFCLLLNDNNRGARRWDCARDILGIASDSPGTNTTYPKTRPQPVVRPFLGG